MHPAISYRLMRARVAGLHRQAPAPRAGPRRYLGGQAVAGTPAAAMSERCRAIRRSRPGWAAVPETGPPTWILTFDGIGWPGDRLAAAHNTPARRHPMTLGPGADRPDGAPPHYLGRPAHLSITAARRPRRGTPVADPDMACQQ